MSNSKKRAAEDVDTTSKKTKKKRKASGVDSHEDDSLNTDLGDTSAWRSDRTQEKLATFMEKFCQKPESLTKPPKKKGSPHTLIVAGAGLRAADLFAKHMKVAEQVEFLKNKKTGIGIGTPARLIELIDNGALSLEYLENIIVDASHIDQKKRGILDMKDTMLPLARFLSRKEFKERYVADEKPISLIFY
ncbi:protein CMS1 [Geosmithia morbida]|uniref:Protein CMS1 n=1 Tax=Geosmithia morbida TaxID=1094350 RepID=A0A9P4YXX1_9HYPO|nr:protein CMS1 [Geosmithia morbida]KAF4124527.1 protein CMS1 [Geosmithia morbida]